MGISDGGGDAASSDVGLAARDRGRAVDLVLGDRRTDHSERSSAHVDAATAMVVLAHLGQVRIVLGKIAGDRRVGDGHASETERAARKGENSSTVGMLGGDTVSANYALSD